MTNFPKLRVVTAAPSTIADDQVGADLDLRFLEEVRVELRRVLNSSQFEASERNRRFLEYVVEETLAGRADRIKAYNVATIVFGRDENFDPQLDPVVRMEARRLRRSLERLYLVEGDLGTVRITLPKGGYVPNFQDPAARSRAEQLALQSSRGEAPTYRTSIRVSTFTVEDESPASVDYSDGFVRQLVVGLSRFPELDVFTAKTTAGPHSGVAQPDSASDSDLILAGDTSAASNVFNVKATLVHGRSGKVVWGDTFEQRTSDKGMLDARDRIADRIVRILAEHGVAIVNSSPNGEAERARDVASLEGLVHFNRYRRWPKRDSFSVARDRLERAVVLNPGYSETFACLSQIYTDGHRFGFASPEAPCELKHRALETALQAVELSPTSSRAYHAQGVAHWCIGDADASSRALQMALALNPNATDAMADLGLHKCLLGEWSDGVRLIEESLVGSPVRTNIRRIGLSLYFFHNGQFELALSEANLIGTPHVTHGFVAQAISLVRLGRRSEAQEAVARILGINPRYGREVLHELGVSNMHPALAHEIKSALKDAGLAPASAAS